MPAAIVRRNDRWFYSGIAVVSSAIVFAGFSRTFYLASHYHAPALDTLRIVHGTVFSSWIFLFVVQTSLIAGGWVGVHRRLGWAGAAIATTMFVVGNVLAVSAAREGRAPPGIEPLRFLAIPLFDLWMLFGPFVAAAVYFRRQPETHKRLMVLATITLLAAAAARLPVAWASAGPLFYFGVVDTLLLCGVAYDAVTRGKVHPVYVWGGLLVLASQPLRLWVTGTSGWLAFARMLTGN